MCDVNHGLKLPNVTFHTRVRDESVGGDNPFRWQDVTSEELWGKGRHIVFSLPGAFTPTCSTYQLPGFEEKAADGTWAKFNIDSVSVISVNDSFVMNCWARDQEIEHVKVVPDGSGIFTRRMGMLVDKDNLGFGYRSWRYAMIVNNGEVEVMFVEPGLEDNHPEDPYVNTTPDNVLDWLENN